MASGFSIDLLDQPVETFTDEELAQKRSRILTEKAQNNYDERISDFQDKITTTWDRVKAELDKIASCDTIDLLRQLQTSICLLYGDYRLTVRNYFAFLERTRTEESLNRLKDHMCTDQSCDRLVNTILDQLDDRIRNEVETRSTHSRTSCTSRGSNTAMIKAKAKARAAMARMTLIEKEKQLKKKQVDIEVDLQCLKEEQIYEEARAEVEVYEEESAGGSCHESNIQTRLEVPNHRQDTQQRTEEYIDSLPKNVHQSTEEYIDSFPHERKQTTLNPNAKEFDYQRPDACTDFSRFLLRKDLLFSRLTKFDEKPENYSMWKVSFKSVVTELGFGPREELDLLVKWLGADSYKYAISVRASSSTIPDVGVLKLWDRLDERYGSPEVVELSLRKKIDNFPILGAKDSKKLFDLSDVLDEIQNNMQDPRYTDLLSFYNTSMGVIPIVNKLPYNIQEKWTGCASRYKRDRNVPFPPFSYFTEFIRDISKVKNDPSFSYEVKKSQYESKKKMSSMKTELSSTKTSDQSINQASERQLPVNSANDAERTEKFCHYHNVHGHSLNSCRTFRHKPLSVRKKFVRDKELCFNCCEQSNHKAGNCPKDISCSICPDQHPTALHTNFRSPLTVNGGEKVNSPAHPKKPFDIKSACAQVCGKARGGKSCARVVCVNIYHKDKPEQKVKVYALLDDQSNKSLVKPEFFDAFGGTFDEVSYCLTSCAGRIDTHGRRATGFIVENLDGSQSHELPALTECAQIPEIKDEIPSPEVAKAYSHLSDLAVSIPEVDDRIPLLLLIGRDLTEAHHVLTQRLGPKGYPFAQEYSLGWVIIGETCLGRVHIPETVKVNKTYIHSNDRGSIFPECEYKLHLKEKYLSDIFKRTPEDDKKGMSVEDEEFLQIMKNDFTKSPDGCWIAPLPFWSPRPRLPNNRDQALKRTNNLHMSLKKNPEKRQHFIDFMTRIFVNGYAEPAPPVMENECWYLPIFGVYHAKKNNQIRVVFDSSAQYQGLSLNSVLLQGPDLMNSLLGVLMRFRKEPIAVMGDIQQMFFQFRVKKEHRNFLRFIWFKDNDIDSDLMEYRMCSHVFGNSSSPSIASYGLMKTAKEMEMVYGHDVKEFVEKDFYVDDGLSSFPSVKTAIDVISRTQKALLEGGNLRFHKIVSNNKDVMKAFPRADLAKDLQDMSIGTETLPTQKSLGLNWNLKTDCFEFKVSQEEKKLTRRGVLSTVNTLYDPLGFVAPVINQGKVLMRELFQETAYWDEPLPLSKATEWNHWKNQISDLEQLSVPRMYLPIPQSVDKQEIHVFSDASEKAISAVAYMRAVDNNRHLGFILGKSKVSPKSGHTIPRLELCAAILAVEIAETISEQLGADIRQMKFYTDSRVVLGYLNNKVRRFYIYVQNRTSQILRSTDKSQWHYVSTGENPADEGTRPIPASSLQNSKWLNGPDFLKSSTLQISNESYELQSPEQDKEIRPIVQCLKTVSEPIKKIGLDRFRAIGNWRSLVKVVTLLKVKARAVKLKTENHVTETNRADILKEAERFMLKEVQSENFNEEILCINSNQNIPKSSPINKLNPFFDRYGLLCVGGRLKYADGLCFSEKHPVILPKNHFISKLVAESFHENVCHQGCHFTEGAIRSGGYWIVGVKRLVRSIIGKCVKCKKLRGKSGSQIMADLPEDRLTPGPPFSTVGVDVFGPWNVTARRTRGGVSNSKRWAVLYTCLTTRAIHVEVIEELSTSSFINATRRFISIRGPVRIFRSDRGTNFVGATDCMKIHVVNVEDRPMKKFLDHYQTVWIFNSPHSSHMGGVWERLIGVVRRVLESMLSNCQGDLTHEVLTTFMAEVCAIVNSRPLVQVSSDPDNPVVLNPAMLLTQKPAEEGQYLSEICIKDMYKAQWRRVQCLSNMFWKRWKSEYLQVLQKRSKWTNVKRDFQKGDVILVMEDDSPRNDWPIGIITDTYPCEDGHVRKVQVKITRTGDSESKFYVRPITKLVPLIESDDKCE